MTNKAIQSNLPFAAPNDEINDLEFASGETLKNPLHDSMHSDPNEEHSDEVMFDDEMSLNRCSQDFYIISISFKAFLIKAGFGL